MVGVIDVGGGMRDIYGAGAFDRFLDDGVSFDCCVGVSAGSGNLISFLAGQRGRAYRFYCTYSFRKQYMSIGNFIKDGSYIVSINLVNPASQPVSVQEIIGKNGEKLTGLYSYDTNNGKTIKFQRPLVKEKDSFSMPIE